VCLYILPFTQLSVTNCTLVTFYMNHSLNWVVISNKDEALSWITHVRPLITKDYKWMLSLPGFTLGSTVQLANQIHSSLVNFTKL